MAAADDPSGDAGGASRSERQGANLARHLNQSYPDAAEFLARYGGGIQDAADAAFVTVTEQAVVISLSSGSAQAPVTLPLPSSPDDRDLRARLRLLVEQIRADLPEQPPVPLTSLEQMLGGQATGQGGHRR